MKYKIFIGEDTVVFDDEEYDNLLDFLNGSGYEVPSACHNGYCGSCRTPCTYGKVEYEIEPIAYVRKKEILPCVCKPIGNLKLKIR